MSVRKLTLQPVASTSLKRPRALSTQPYTIHVKGVSSKKRIVQSIPTSRQPSPMQPPRIGAIALLPPSSSKKFIHKRSINAKQKPEEVKLDHQVMECRQKRLASKSVKRQGMSRQALSQRKESHLNTYFNIRKNKLKEITKENKQIYVRINSQKSLYSSRKLG